MEGGIGSGQKTLGNGAAGNGAAGNTEECRISGTRSGILELALKVPER